jgi:hypothetical protein
MATLTESAWRLPRESAGWLSPLPSQFLNKHIVGLDILPTLIMLLDHAQPLFLKMAITNKIPFKVLTLADRRNNLRFLLWNRLRRYICGR